MRLEELEKYYKKVREHPYRITQEPIDGVDYYKSLLILQSVFSTFLASNKKIYSNTYILYNFLEHDLRTNITYLRDMMIIKGKPKYASGRNIEVEHFIIMVHNVLEGKVNRFVYKFVNDHILSYYLNKNRLVTLKVTEDLKQWAGGNRGSNKISSRIISHILDADLYKESDNII